MIKHKIYTTHGHRYLAYVTLPHDRRLWWSCKQISMRTTNPFEPIPLCIKSGLTGKNSRYFVTCHTSILVCTDQKQKCFVKKETDVIHRPFVTLNVCCVLLS